MDEPAFRSRAPAALLAAAAAAFLGALWLAGGALAGDAADILGAEPFVVNAVQRLALGHALYPDPEEPPFAAIQYTPALYQASAAALRTLGADPRDPEPATRVVRGVSAACWLAALALAGSWLLRIGAGAAATAGLLAWWTVQSGVWWFLARPDSAQTLLLFAALAAGAKALAGERAHLGWTALAAALGVAAGFAKQNGWLAGPILLAALALRREWRAGALALLVAGAGHALLHGLAWRQWGSAWPLHIFGTLDNGIRLDRAAALAWAPAGQQSAVALGFAGALAWRWRKVRDERQFLAVAWALSLAFAVVSALKVGSADNYFIDAWGLSALLAGHAVADLRRLRPRAVPMVLAAAAFALLLFAPAKLFDSWARREAALRYAPLRPAADRLAELLADKPGAWAFCDDQRFACLLPERVVAPQFLLSELGHGRGHFHYRKFAALAAQGDLAVAVLGQESAGTPALRILSASLEPFREIARLGRWRVLVHGRWR